MDILDDMGVSKLSAKVFSKVNYSFNAALGVDWDDLGFTYWPRTKAGTETAPLRLIREILHVCSTKCEG